MQTRLWSATRTVGLVLLMMGVYLCVASLPAQAVQYQKGDVFAGVGSGTVKHFAPNGTLIETLQTNAGNFYDTGMCFDATGNLYTTNFSNMSKFDNQGNLLLSNFGSGFNADPESCVLDSAGHIYAGQADGAADILQFDQAGNLLATFSPTTAPRGTDWIDLAADQCTIFYTSESPDIRRFNVCTNTQLSDFCTSCGTTMYALRILSDGGVLVADSGAALVRRFNASGVQTQTYTATGLSYPFALNRDPDGTSFWTGDLFNGQIFKFDIASGAVLTQFNSAPLNVLGGLTIFGEPTAAKTGNKCPLSQGFWQTHPAAWPVSSLKLGSQTYTQAQLLTILTTPTRGDASLILADQLIAAKLDILNGSNPAPISSTITDADNLLSQFGVTNRLPYNVQTSSTIGQQMVNDANVLDRYNNDVLTPDCKP